MKGMAGSRGGVAQVASEHHGLALTNPRCDLIAAVFSVPLITQMAVRTLVTRALCVGPTQHEVAVSLGKPVQGVDLRPLVQIHYRPNPVGVLASTVPTLMEVALGRCTGWLLRTGGECTGWDHFPSPFHVLLRL